MLQNTPARKYYYSLRNVADFKGKILENALSGLVMTVNEKEVHFRLIGEFNAYNLLAVYGAAICLGENSEEVLRALSALQGAEEGSIILSAATTSSASSIMRIRRMRLKMFYRP